MRNFPDPPPTSCKHVWEHIWNINGVAVDAKYIQSVYVVWCPNCGSYGKQDGGWGGLKQNKVEITYLAYEDSHRQQPKREALISRGAAMDLGLRV